mmetsp:Transcript_14299/g.38790  ORF Transcript_14299/g.38790 Transcript_14299/m.38790 type:complete len:83 (-) Transcript_14299:615-863(-)
MHASVPKLPKHKATALMAAAQEVSLHQTNPEQPLSSKVTEALGHQQPHASESTPHLTREARIGSYHPAQVIQLCSKQGPLPD